MADDVTIYSEIAPAGSIPFEPSSGSMTFELTPLEDVQEDITDNQPGKAEEAKYIQQLSNLMPEPSTAQVPSSSGSTKRVCIFDLETTGTSQFKSKMIVGTFWMIGREKSTMETFASFDEELITNQMADYLNRENPERLVAYNIAFDRVFLLSRFMLYGLQVPCMKTAENFDMMDVLSKGGTDYAKAISSVGKAEEWLFYLFGETKPYLIDECLEDVANGSLEKMTVRNRVCVGSEGDLYMLLMYVWGEPGFSAGLASPSLQQLDEAKQIGIWRVQCPNCLTANDYDSREKTHNCFLCGTKLDPNKTYDPAVTRSSQETPESKYIAEYLPDWRKNQVDTSKAKK